MARRAKARRGRRPARSRILLRWLALGLIVLVGLLYVRPFQRYLETRSALRERQAEVRSLREEHRRLERTVEVSTSQEALLAEARKLGFVKPGERLFIVKGISECLRQKCWRPGGAK
jgi:cell division protein FtsB